MAINSQASRDGILETHLRTYGNALTKFRADRVFKTSLVDDFTGVFMEVDDAFGAAEQDLDFFRSQLGAYPEIPFDVSEQTGWNLDDMGIQYSVDQKAARRLAGRATMVDAVRHFGRIALNVLMLRRERLAATRAFDTTAASSASRSVTLTAPDQVDNESSQLIKNIDTWLLAFADAQGLDANCVTMNEKVALSIARHPGIIEYLSRTQGVPGTLATTQDMTPLEQRMAQVFKVAKANVCSAKYNSAQPGQTRSLARVWGDHILLAHQPDAIVEGEPNGAAVRWQLRGGDQQTVRRWQSQGGLVEHRSISYDEEFWMDSSWDEAYLIVNAHS